MTAAFTLPSTTSSDTLITQKKDLESAGSKACLVKIHPAVLGEGFIELPNERCTIGRETDCHLSLSDDKAVSRQHAFIDWRGDHFILVDFGSTNGTYVNDEPISERSLVTGDLIRIGSHILKFLCNDIEAQYHQTIYSMIITDGLTGVFSARYFHEALERELVRSQRHQRPLSLVMLDIDHFKSVNDSHSHLVGNEVLRELCRRLAPSIRRDEVFARWGGEEFVILLPEAAGAQAAIFAERLRRIICEEAFEVGSISLPITVSMGVGYTAGDPDIDPKKLIHLADKNMLKAKATGRNCVCS